MKHITSLLLLLLLPLLSQAQQDCSKFKNGRFIYPDQDKVLSVRKNGIQKSVSNGKTVAIWKVDWIDDCHYNLTCKKLKAPMPPFEKGDILECSIVGIQGDCMKVDLVFKRNGKLMMPKTSGEMCLE